MKLIIGLGNPGEQYENTRHNTGFWAVDFLAHENKWKKVAKLNSLVCEIAINGKKLILAKPETFMNDSGLAARKLADFYKLGLEDILIIFDDIDLLAGQMRLRDAGSAGGHNGLQSVIRHLGSENFARLKIGIAEEQPGKQTVPAEDYVLKPFSKAGKEKVKKTLKHVPNLVEKWLAGVKSFSL